MTGYKRGWAFYIYWKVTKDFPVYKACMHSTQ